MFNSSQLSNDSAFDNRVMESSGSACQDLTQWGIFLSSLLLSLTGIVSMCMMGCRRSNCTEVSVCQSCLEIKRTNLDIEV